MEIMKFYFSNTDDMNNFRLQKFRIDTIYLGVSNENHVVICSLQHFISNQRMISKYCNDNFINFHSSSI